MMASFVYREDGSSIKKSAITSGMAGSPASASIADSISIRAEHGTADRSRSKSPANAQFTKPDEASTSKFVFKSLDPPPRLSVNQPPGPTSHSSEPGTKTHLRRPPSLSPRKPHVSESGPSRGTSASPVGGKGLSSSAGVPESLLKRLAGPSTNKAGLLRDPAEVRQIIYEASKGSTFFRNEQIKDAQTTAQIKVMLEKLARRVAERGGNLVNEENEVARVCEALDREERDLSQAIVVIDCDAFYASVEELDDPSLKGKAFCVGSGVLTTASYEARRYGCRSAMAGYIAKVLCPHLIFIKPDFTKYTAASRKVMEVLSRYDPNYAAASLDEAYLNMTEYVQKSGLTPAEAVQKMRDEVKIQTGLTVSAGVAPNAMLAKIAADINKPNGQFVVEPTRQKVMEFMSNMSVRKIPGVGRVTERWLEALDVQTCSDIWKHRGRLTLIKSELGLTFLLRAYLGLGNTNIEPGKREDRKSVGCETTFSTLYKTEDLYEKVSQFSLKMGLGDTLIYIENGGKLREIADDLARDLERLNFTGKTITFKFKMDTYQSFTRAKTLNGYIASADDLYKWGKILLDNELDIRKNSRNPKERGHFRVRLMGLRMTNLRDERSLEEGGTKTSGVGSLDGWASKSSSSKAVAAAHTPTSTDPTDSLEWKGQERYVMGSSFDPISDSGASTSASGDGSRKRKASSSGQEKPPTIRPFFPSSKTGDAAATSTSMGAETVQELTCPVCTQQFRMSLQMFNKHLDECLKGGGGGNGKGGGKKGEGPGGKKHTRKGVGKKGGPVNAFERLMKGGKER